MTSATRTPHQDQHNELGTRGGGGTRIGIRTKSSRWRISRDRNSRSPVASQPTLAKGEMS